MRRLLLAVLILVLTALASSAQTAASIETKLLTRLANIEKWSNYSAESDYDRLEKENELLKRELLDYARRPELLTYRFARLTKEMQIVTSTDGRLRIYSWDRQTGGTMHDFDSVYQYRGGNGKVYSTSATDGTEDSGGVFYHQIFQLNTPSGPIYLPVSTFIGSSSLRGESIEIVRIGSDKLSTDSKLIRTGSGLVNSINFGYDFFSVVDRPERPIRLFKFDAATRTFSFPVVIEDDKTPQGRVTNKLIRYRFDGTYFVKVS